MNSFAPYTELPAFPEAFGASVEVPWGVQSSEFLKQTTEERERLKNLIRVSVASKFGPRPENLFSMSPPSQSYDFPSRFLLAEQAYLLHTKGFGSNFSVPHFLGICAAGMCGFSKTFIEGNFCTNGEAEKKQAEVVLGEMCRTFGLGEKKEEWVFAEGVSIILKNKNWHLFPLLIGKLDRFPGNFEDMLIPALEEDRVDVLVSLGKAHPFFLKNFIESQKNFFERTKSKKVLAFVKEYRIQGK